MNRDDAYKAGREARKAVIKARFEALKPVAKKPKTKLSKKE
tara:strand:- start:494 stop:616 length:123 start_codon:yes stop_codon:yes gene_type:complete